MIRFVYARDLGRYPVLARSMFRDRAVQFRDRLDWEVSVDADGCERDQYDVTNPLYLIWEEADGSHGASMRVLPTIGRTMVDEIFPELAGGAQVRGPFIWECTRFCITPTSAASARHLAGALMLAGHEVGLQFGLEYSVGVYDARMVRIYRRIGWEPEKVGETGEGRDRICMGLWPFAPEIRDRIAANAGLDSDLGRYWFDLSFPVPQGALQRSA